MILKCMYVFFLLSISDSWTTRTFLPVPSSTSSRLYNILQGKLLYTIQHTHTHIIAVGTVVAGQANYYTAKRYRSSDSLAAETSSAGRETAPRPVDFARARRRRRRRAELRHRLYIASHLTRYARIKYYNLYVGMAEYGFLPYTI